MNFEYDRFCCLVIFKVKTCNKSALPGADPELQIRTGVRSS